MRHNAPSLSRNTLPIGKAEIRHEPRIDPFAATSQPAFRQSLHHRAAPGIGIAKSPDLATRLGRKPCGQGRVIEMGMGHQHMADPLPRLDGCQNSRKMLRIVRPRIDHGNIRLAQQIGIGAAIGHGGRVRRQEPPYRSADLFGHADDRGETRIRILHAPLPSCLPCS